ncbi:MAG: hypothetical protein OEY24_03435 [Candidatus Bathyarchaeota archaeon]|nr:hypothetical protein [Candidatus Bathyarchaeota archaeon]MDH5494737.1 hypothetical protein [Candidatus Bathyarchaeota archaeon]
MSEAKNVEGKPESGKTRMKIARPLQNLDAVNKVVRVMYGYKTAVMYKDIASACGMHPVNVSQALSAAHDIGLTESAGRKGLYNLTSEGKDYARLLTAGKENEAKNLLKHIIRQNPLWVEIIRFLDATRGQPRDPLDLVLEIERKVGKQWSTSTRGAIRESLVSILEYAQMIVKEGPQIISVGEEQIETESEAEQRTEPLTPQVDTYLDSDFEFLKSSDFTFEVRKDAKAVEFAQTQFAAWITYLKKKLAEEKQDARQSGGVPNQITQ